MLHESSANYGSADHSAEQNQKGEALRAEGKRGGAAEETTGAVLLIGGQPFRQRACSLRVRTHRTHALRFRLPGNNCDTRAIYAAALPSKTRLTVSVGHPLRSQTKNSGNETGKRGAFFCLCTFRRHHRANFMCRPDFPFEVLLLSAHLVRAQFEAALLNWRLPASPYSSHRTLQGLTSVQQEQSYR